MDANEKLKNVSDTLKQRDRLGGLGYGAHLDLRFAYGVIDEVLAGWTPPAQTDAEPVAAVEFTYTNWRGETGKRRAVPISLHYGSTEWHTEPQWLLRAFDLDKQAERDFALDECTFAHPAPAQTDEARVEMLVEALRFYADENMYDEIAWGGRGPKRLMVLDDDGKTARDALDAVGAPRLPRRKKKP